MDGDVALRPGAGRDGGVTPAAGDGDAGAPGSAAFQRLGADMADVPVRRLAGAVGADRLQDDEQILARGRALRNQVADLVEGGVLLTLAGRGRRLDRRPQ